MRKRGLSIILIVLLLGTSISLIGAFGIEKVREFLYKEISYQFVADEVVGDEKDEEKAAILLCNYIHTHLNVAGGEVMDRDSWNDLVRGIAWCDQQSWALATLLSKCNIYARFAMLKDRKGSSPHTVTEVFLSGDWKIFDPLNGLVFRSKDGSLATLEEISNDIGIISRNPKVISLGLKEREAFLNWYKGMFPMPRQPERWAPLLTKKTYTLPRKIVHNSIMAIVRLLGRPFVNAYQDVYLLVRSGSFSEPYEFAYFKARNYHLYQRTDAAQRAYRYILQNYPQSNRVEDCLYYLGVLCYESGQYEAAIEFLHSLLADYPRTRWSKMAHYFLGRNFEDSGETKRAQAHYKYAAIDLDTDAAWRLFRLENQ